MKLTALSERERRFVEFFMGETAGNATKAARLAGYTKNTAEKQAHRLLAKVGVRAAIDERTKRDPAVATREQRQQFWTDVMNGVGKFATASLKDKLRASELLARASGDFLDRVDLTSGGKPVQVNVVTGIPEARRDR